MPKGKNQKFKLYRLAQIMSEQTDEDHYITMPEIMSALEEYEITADRKSIYADLKDLEKLGIEIGEPLYGGKFFTYIAFYLISLSCDRKRQFYERLFLFCIRKHISTNIF